MTPSSSPTHPGGTGTLGGAPVSRIGYGAMQLGERPGTAVAHDDAIAVLRHTVELGITHIDTAEFYGPGLANRLIREALHPYRDDLVLVSKVGADRAPEGAPVSLVAAQKPHELRASVEANLHSLGAERIDVVNLRRADNPPGIVATGDQVVPLDDQLAELSVLRDEGKIGAIGLSNVRVDQLEGALPAGIVCVQNHYNMVARSGEDVLALCEANDIAFVPYFPLGSAFPGQRRVTDEKAVQDAGARLGATPAQVGLAWLLAHSPSILLIPGTGSIEHLDENAAAGDVVLDGAALAELDTLG